MTLDPALNQMAIYDWGNADCSLPASALSAGLLGEFTQLAAGDYLLFDNGQGLRDVVRLTEPPEIITAVVPGSPPSATAVTMVRWSRSTPLTGCYCLSQTVVRGNLVPATHGLSASENLRNLKPAQIAQVNSEIAATPAGQKRPRQRLTVSQAPLAHLDPRNVRIGKRTPTASGCFRNRLHCAIGARHQHARGIRGRRLWQQKPTLLDSQADDQVYRVEIGDDGEATVVFGDGTFGAAPPETSVVTANYRVGGGAAGNVGAHTLIAASSATPMPWLLSVTNPVAATGGRDLESSDHARRIGPGDLPPAAGRRDRVRLRIGCRGVRDSGRKRRDPACQRQFPMDRQLAYRPAGGRPDECRRAVRHPCSNRCCSS